MKRAALLLLLTGGCAYYNGMYNAKHLAHDARKAEREGRVAEATNLWGQVELKAESVVVHHPTSRWSDEARLLQGTALVKLGNCDGALHPLETVLSSTRDSRLGDDAAMLIGGCRADLGDADGAMVAYARLLNSRDPERRSIALYQHGHALRLLGRFEEAAGELGASRHPRAKAEWAAAVAGIGRVPEALAVADSLAASGDTTAPWPSLLALIGERDPEAAAALVDRIVAAPAFSPTLKATLLLEDGERWLGHDSNRGDARLLQADSAARDTPVLTSVRLERARTIVARAATMEDLNQAASELEDFGGPVAGGGQSGPRLAATARLVMATADSTPPGTPRGDLRLFLAGELARDSLGAPRFAANQFRRVALGWPDSPFAPKALLALIDLEPEGADTVRAVLLDRYRANPYVAISRGAEAPEYEALEDSLRLFQITFQTFVPQGPTRSIQPGRPKPPQPTTPRRPADIQ
jgi:tetratricopeptide (TPR) repeat protein